jgi:hypothetical protein
MADASTTYRVYKLDRAHHIVSGEWIDAASDQEAIARSHELCDQATPAVELWCGPRRLGVFPCENSAN